MPDRGAAAGRREPSGLPSSGRTTGPPWAVGLCPWGAGSRTVGGVDELSGPRVLVAVASRHGATVGIAESIAEGIRAGLPGSAVDVRRAADVADISGYDAVVLGSAVYFGHWLEEARELLLRCAIPLWNLPVWIFSSGPVGHPARPPEGLLDIDEVQRLTRAVEHRLFPGRLDPSLLDFGERAVVVAVAAAHGDFRDPAAARAWGAGIAAAVAGSTTADEPVAR